MWHPPPILEYYCRIYRIWQQPKVSWVVKCLMNNSVCVLTSDDSVYLKEIFCYMCCILFEAITAEFSNQMKDISSFCPFRKHAAKRFKQNLCSNFNIFSDFPNFCVIGIIQFHFRWNIIRFYLRRKKIKKSLNPSRVIASCFGLSLQRAFTLSILLQIILFWSSWTLASFTFFSMWSPVVEW